MKHHSNSKVCAVTAAAHQPAQQQRGAGPTIGQRPVTALAYSHRGPHKKASLINTSLINYVFVKTSALKWPQNAQSSYVSEIPPFSWTIPSHCACAHMIQEVSSQTKLVARRTNGHEAKFPGGTEPPRQREEDGRVGSELHKETAITDDDFTKQQ